MSESSVQSIQVQIQSISLKTSPKAQVFTMVILLGDEPCEGIEIWKAGLADRERDPILSWQPQKGVDASGIGQGPNWT